MRNKFVYLIIFFISLFIVNMNICCADIYKGVIKGTGVRLRSGPGTNYNEIGTVSNGREYTLVDGELKKSEKKCTNGWYQIYYDGASTGYVCSDYIEVTKVVFNETPTNDCEKSLADAGFPSSYWPSLCSLKEKYPNWKFYALNTGLDFSDAVNNESACGVSYISSSVETNIDRSCTNEYDSVWYPASSTAVAYYMDPRNWLTEQYIFQFEYLKYDSNLSNYYTDASNSIIDHTKFYEYHKNLGNNLGSIINTVSASDDVNINPIFLTARILQELGSTEKLYNLYSGVYSGYEGYYNFYNFAVTDSCATTDGPTLCGLKYAKNKNWYGLQNAIKGGAIQIAENYIAQGQYSTYLQRYNVVPKNSNKLYVHQYMTNVAAPSSESKTTYKSYNEMGILNGSFSFYIPVYNNMDDTSFNQSSGATNVPDSDNTTSVDINTIITSSGYKTSGEYLTGVSPETSVSALTKAIESIAGSGNVKIKNVSSNLVTDGLVGTGYKVTIKSSVEEKTFTILINGDTSGDGKINALDLLQVQKDILDTYTLSGVYYLAGDTSDDGTINALDLLQIQKDILDTYEIVQ